MNPQLPAFTDEGPRHAPPLVLLHSLATHGGLWAPQVPVWVRAWRVIRIDLPGHGRTQVTAGASSLADFASDIVRVFDHLRLDRVAVVGLSLGGMVAQSLALNHPGRVGALVLAHCSALTDTAVRDIWSQRLAHFISTGLPGQVKPTLDRWFPRSFAERSPLTMAWMAGMIESTSPAGYAAAIGAIQQLDHLDRLHEISVPTLVVAGEADAAVPPAVARGMADRISGCHFMQLEGTGHIGNVQVPHEFTERVGAFLDTSASA